MVDGLFTLAQGQGGGRELVKTAESPVLTAEFWQSPIIKPQIIQLFNICALGVSFRFTIINKQSSVVFATAAVLYQRLPRDLMTRWTDHIAAVNGQFGWPIKDD